MSGNPGAPLTNTNYPPAPPPPQIQTYPYFPTYPPLPPGVNPQTGFQPPTQNFQTTYQPRENYRNRDGYHGKRNDYHNRNNNRNNNHNNDQRQERNDPIHTVFFHNIYYNTSLEDFKNYAAQFGEISNVFTKFAKGIAFVTYYDIRSAEKAVKSEYGKINGREVKTSFAYRPPAHSKRDPCESCSTVQVKIESDISKVNLEDVQDELQKFGEIREAKNCDDSKEFIIKFFDLRSAKQAVQKDGLDIKGETARIEYLPEEDEGDDPADHPPPQHHHHNRGNSNNSNNNNGNGAPQQIPYPGPYGAPMQPPFDQMGYTAYPGMFGQPYGSIPSIYGYPGVPPAPPPPPPQYGQSIQPNPPLQAQQPQQNPQAQPPPQPPQLIQSTQPNLTQPPIQAQAISQSSSQQQSQNQLSPVQQSDPVIHQQLSSAEQPQPIGVSIDQLKKFDSILPNEP